MKSTSADSSRMRLLACGLIAGPVYVVATLIEAATREGFDITRHRFTLLTAGDFGWIHQANMVLAGFLTLLFALGVRRSLRTGRGATTGPVMIALLGAAYAFGGLLTADPVLGMPPGTTADMVQTTLAGWLQNLSRGVSTLILLVASVLLSSWFFGQGQRRWGWITVLLVPVTFAGLSMFGAMLGGNPVALAFLATPWIWLTTIAWRLRVIDGYAA